MYDRNRLKKYQEQFEGRRRMPYDDKTGRKPILITSDGDEGGSITIGVGWNLSARGIPEHIIDMLHDIAIDEVHLAVDKKYPWFRTLDNVRQMVIIDMAYNMGIDTFDTFKNTIMMIRNRSYIAASQAMLNSRWAKQVGKRAVILSVMMQTGEEPVDA